MEVVAVFIPIIFIITTGLVIITVHFFQSREKQMLIEKGLTTDEIKEFYTNKRSKDNFILFKIGIVCFFFGLGLGIGLIMNDMNDRDYWVPLFLFTLTGLGFVVANLASLKLEKSNK